MNYWFGFLAKRASCGFLLSLALASTEPMAQSTANPCQFNVCKDLYEANELGMQLELILKMKALGEQVPDWTFNLPQQYAEDLGVHLNLKDAVNFKVTEAAADPVHEILDLLGAKGPEVVAAFNLGSQMTDYLILTTALQKGKGDAVRLSSEGELLRRWRNDSIIINRFAADAGTGKNVDETIGQADDIQRAICSLKNSINQVWQRPTTFLCGAFLDRIRRGLDALGEAKPKNSVIAERLPAQSSIDVIAFADGVDYRVNGVGLPRVDIASYQDGVDPGFEDETVGGSSVAIRLGRDKDMLLISAFGRSGGRLCATHLFLRLRDGDDIVVSRNPISGVVGDFDLYGVTYGRNHDLFNVIGVKYPEFIFTWDPSAPRPGLSGIIRNPITPVSQGVDRDIVPPACI